MDPVLAADGAPGDHGGLAVAPPRVRALPSTISTQDVHQDSNREHWHLHIDPVELLNMTKHMEAERTVSIASGAVASSACR